MVVNYITSKEIPLPDANRSHMRKRIAHPNKSIISLAINALKWDKVAGFYGLPLELFLATIAHSPELHLLPT